MVNNMPSTAHLKELTTFAATLADAASEITLKYFKQDIGVDNKLAGDDFDPVTIADRDAETTIRKLIEAQYPDHGIIGEEHGTIRGGADFIWVLDPVDGTRAFICGVASWGTLIGLQYKGEPVLGVIDQPYLKERYIGSRLGSTLNGKPISTRDCPSMKTATVATTDPALFNADELAIWNDIIAEAKLTRYGLDCYAYAVLSAGFIDGVIEAGLKIYDMMALIPVIRGAGGTVTDWHGNPPVDKNGNCHNLLAASSPALHSALLVKTKEI